MGSTVRARKTRVRSILAALGLVAGMLALLAPEAGAASSCEVKVNRVWVASNLSSVIATAPGGSTIAFRGICVGNFTISKNLTLVGKATKSVPKATLDGNNNGTVVTINTGVKVSLNNLLVTHGSDGGIYNNGTVSLKGHTLVSGNDAGDGGGIYNLGTVILARFAAVNGNTAGRYGGGIYNSKGIVTLKDSSSVCENTAENIGGGIVNAPSYGNGLSTLTLKGSSSVCANTTGGYGGGGIINFGALTMTDSSSVTGNTSGGGGGGIWNDGFDDYGHGGVITMSGSSSVSGNTAAGGGSFGGGGIANFSGIITLRGSSSVTGNTASVGVGGIEGDGGVVYGCDSTGVDEWTGAIRPNNPDNSTAVTPIAC